MSDKPKYWVPALEKAHAVLNLIADQPGRFKLIELSRTLEINKSSMFSLLQTMEALEWVKRETGDTYSIGRGLSRIGFSFAQHYDVKAQFRQEGAIVRSTIGETLQLAKLAGWEVLYLEKLEVPSPVRLVSEPGMRFPAYATGLGKALLAFEAEERMEQLLQESELSQLTPYTLTDMEKLRKELRLTRERGVAYDMQEAVMGFNCIAAPVFNQSGKAVYAVSCSMPVHCWPEKKDAAEAEIRQLAERLAE
ncbi:IclR family transcriptional regulator [Paenibacillus sp. GCM10027626]|uniref:IclR family transcriptional regulator n=1 Tax=Paenibacillus sp. GCM10027626 TaxID=3273411 RepID=UPI00363F8792